MRTRSAVATAVVGALLAAVPAPAATYPSPPPDFGHFDEPHSRLFSWLGGNQDRPMLVVYAEFADVRFPAGIDAPAMARRFFGPFPSVAGYYANDSGGRLVLSPAAESNISHGGMPDDGVVSVGLASTKQAFNSQTKPNQIRALLRAADPYVNFSAFDRNGDGRVAEDELIVHRVDADPDPVTEGCAQTQRSADVTLDGKRLGGLSVTLGGTDTNLITLIHETGHAAFEMPDTYFWDVGAMDLAGYTCGYDDSKLFRTSAFQKVHLNWIRPTVVTRDGYYHVDRSVAGRQAYILYDLDKGEDDYFLVENRARTAGTYDQGTSDSGLVIWRIDDSVYTRIGAGEAAGDDTGFIYPMRPTASKGARSAWDPSDPTTPQRTMRGNWRDGTPANVAVRAIWPAGPSIRAFFDVRGPGVLVDTYPLNAGGRRPSLTPGQANEITFRVRNTGESSDSFAFGAAKLPAEWSATTANRTLAAGASSTVTIEVTPPLSKGTFTLQILGRSRTNASVSSSAPLVVSVAPPSPAS